MYQLVRNLYILCYSFHIAIAVVSPCIIFLLSSAIGTLVSVRCVMKKLEFAYIYSR